MITLRQFAKFFQTRLNDALNSNEIEFAIWADAGRYQNAIRSGNIVNAKIHGLLSVSTGANDANNVITIGVNGLVLNVLVPLYTPRTSAAQTAEDLQAVQDNAFVFAEKIREFLDNFFQQPQTVFMTDSKGVQYSVSYKAGTAATGVTELRPAIGNSTMFSVYIEVTFAEGGISSKSISVSIDGNLIPFQNVRFGRAPALERDVFSGDVNSTAFSSSTMFSIDADFPATISGAPRAALDYLLNGEQNTAHFVTVQWADGLKKSFFMTFATIQNAATGVNIMGVSVALVELAGNPALYNVPEGFGLYKFKFNKSVNEDGSVPSLTFRYAGLSSDKLPLQYYVSGAGFGALTLGAGDVDIPLTETPFDWSEEDGAYYVTLVTMQPLTIQSHGADGMTILQG